MLAKSKFKRFSNSSSKRMEREQNHVRNASCPGTANGHKAQWGFRRFCKDKSLEDEECRGQHRKLITTNWEGHQRWPSYNHTGQRTQCGPFYGCSTFQANWKGEKAQWVSASWADWNEKNCHFEAPSCSMQQQWTTSSPHYDVQQKVGCIRQLVRTSSVAGSKRSSKALPKVKLAPEKGHGHCLVVCCPADPPQLSKSRWNPYIWEVCPANQWDEPKTAMPAANSGPQEGPNSSPWQCPKTRCTTNASKVEWIGLQSLASFAIFIWPLANQLPFLQASQQLFAGKTLQPRGSRKCFPRIFWTLNYGLFYAIGINKHFSLVKMYWL